MFGKQKKSFCNSVVSNVVTLSIGLCLIYPDNEATLESIYKQCDDALYMAKKIGRNTIYLGTLQ